MKCPYCGENGVFDNSNLNHKFRHNDDKCNHYFKVCPFCGTIYVENRYEVKDEKAIKVNNLFEIDTCTVCGKGWMPDFPTSWMRSLTNIGKIYDVIYDCTRISEGKISKDVLLDLQRSHNGVIFNKERANSRGNKEYISGALGRRMSDYLLVLKNMNILKETIDSSSYEFTEFGNLFKELNDLNEIFAFLITACCNIKITNIYQKDNSGSVYKYFKIRYIENILKVCEVNEKNGNSSTIEDFGVSFLARDVKEFEDKVLPYILNYNDDALREQFFNTNNKELNRSVKSAFVNILVSLGILNNDGKYYRMTEIGKGLLNILKEFPAIWIDDIKTNNEDIVKAMSYILVWRMVNTKILTKEELKISLDELEKFVISVIPNFGELNDIHFNLDYDENETFNKGLVLNYIKNNLILSDIDSNISELCDALSSIMYYKVFNLVSKNTDILNQIFENIDSDTLRQNVQSGKKWHEKVKFIFNELDFHILDYREKPMFENIIIDKLTLDLPGGTIYNPDMIIFDERIGKNGCILVDAKDENSINAEVHKLKGYNLYCSDDRVDSFCIIALRGKLPERTKRNIEQYKDDFNKIVIIEEKALEKLKEQGKGYNEVFELISLGDGFKLITDSNV